MEVAYGLRFNNDGNISLFFVKGGVKRSGKAAKRWYAPKNQSNFDRALINYRQ